MKILLTKRAEELFIQQRIESSKQSNLYNPLPGVSDETRNGCSSIFNFKDPNIRVIGIDRVSVGCPLDERTVVGYYFNKDYANSSVPVIKLWEMYCSRENHQRLVQDYRDANKEVVSTRKIIKG